MKGERIVVVEEEVVFRWHETRRQRRGECGADSRVGVHYLMTTGRRGKACQWGKGESAEMRRGGEMLKCRAMIQ